MPVSQAPASLNRFPGLTLRAWCLYNGNTVVAGMNMASVASGAGSTAFTMNTGVNGGVFVIDHQIGGAVEFVQKTISSATTFTLNFSDKTGTSVSGSLGYVAVYGP